MSDPTEFLARTTYYSSQKASIFSNIPLRIAETLADSIETDSFINQFDRVWVSQFLDGTA
ncbi:hypothetical protein [Microcoleus sp. AT3-D2]|uniref:hypothetical protein n=1 Tax=Microcoleus sp. AT3-D2 TaxID=2818612 RepID=UPI002FD1925E